MYEFTGHETEGLNTLILLVGSIYAVILAFAIFVIWGQFTDVENAVMRETNTLADLLRFSEYVPSELTREIQKAVEGYAQRVVKYEWQALGHGRRDPHARGTVFGSDHDRGRAGPNDSAGLAGICISRSPDRHRPYRGRTPGSTRSGEHDTNSADAVRLREHHCHGVALAGVGLSVPSGRRGRKLHRLVTIILFLANFVMRDMDNPLDGAWNISAKPFSELKY